MINIRLHCIDVITDTRTQKITTTATKNMNNQKHLSWSVLAIVALKTLDCSQLIISGGFV